VEFFLVKLYLSRNEPCIGKTLEPKS